MSTEPKNKKNTSQEINDQNSTQMSTLNDLPVPLKSTENPKPTNYKYSTEYKDIEKYYNFQIKKFFDDTYNSIVDYGSDCMDDIERNLRKKYTDEKDYQMINDSINKAHDLLAKATDVSFDAFELYVLPNVLKLPNGFKPVEKKVKEQSPTPEEKLNEEIMKLRVDINNVSLIFLIFKERKQNRLLKEQNENFQRELKFYDTNREKFEIIDRVLKKENCKFLKFKNFLVNVSMKDVMGKLLDEATKLNNEFKKLGLEDVEESTDKKQKLQGIENFIEKL